jgi:hypothetical protein
MILSLNFTETLDNQVTAPAWFVQRVVLQIIEDIKMQSYVLGKT